MNLLEELPLTVVGTRVTEGDEILMEGGEEVIDDYKEVEYKWSSRSDVFRLLTVLSFTVLLFSLIYGSYYHGLQWRDYSPLNLYLGAQFMVLSMCSEFCLFMDIMKNEGN